MSAKMMGFSSRFQELRAALDGAVYSTQHKISEEEAMQEAFFMIRKTVLQKGIVYVVGNGGSAGIASHFCNDLMKALKIASQTLYDSNLMTCLANDIGYDHVFSYPLEKLLKPNDLLVAISSSGKSPNIINAANVAISKRAALFTLSGFSADNPLRKMGQLNYWIDRADYGLVEMAHFFLLHTLIDLWHTNTSPAVTHELFATSSAK